MTLENTSNKAEGPKNPIVKSDRSDRTCDCYADLFVATHTHNHSGKCKWLTAEQQV